MTILVLLVLLLALANALGLRWGADSRDGRDWQPAVLSGGRRR